MRLPTVKLMVKRGFTEEQATKIRKLMEKFADRYPFGDVKPAKTMENIGSIMGCEIQEIRKGRNQKSPAITYVNTGDPYDTTVMWVQGQFVIGNWGYYVERGNYD